MFSKHLNSFVLVPSFPEPSCFLLSASCLGDLGTVEKGEGEVDIDDVRPVWFATDWLL